MKTISFYVGTDDLRRIQAEQKRFATMGVRLSKSAAIRSLIQRASETEDDMQLVPINPENSGFWPAQGKGKVFV